eukprot:6175661-Pleurochrysis_carterae.AAC.1
MGLKRIVACRLFLHLAHGGLFFYRAVVLVRQGLCRLARTWHARSQPPRCNVPAHTHTPFPSGCLASAQDAASPRYIFTKLPQLTRLIFHPDDDALLNFLEEDGQSIEPAFYVPILPMVLVNGADGIGTGWSTNVPNYNPREIVANLRRMMDGEEPLPMDPWYRGFSGTVTQADSKGTYLTYGVVSKLDSTTLKITELPVRKWTQDYKESVIEPMVAGGEKAEASLQARAGGGALPWTLARHELPLFTRRKTLNDSHPSSCGCIPFCLHARNVRV